jgi:hypothetical protein
MAAPRTGTTSPTKEDTMVSLKGVLKTGVAVKAIEIARREAAKPENQRRARQVVQQVLNRRSGKHPR